jgi:hypothetical protein
MRAIAPWLVAVALIAGAASARPGAANDPIVVRMKRGADTVRLTGDLRQNQDCCAYLIKAHAGQSLRWRVSGPAIRTTITYPDGHVDGPGLPDAIALPADGDYVFTVRPNLMADGAFGVFVLRLTIPPIPARRD